MLTALLAVVFVTAILAAPAYAGHLEAPAFEAESHEKPKAPPPDRYIVVLEDSVERPGWVAERHSENRGAEVHDVYRYAIKGYAAKIPPGQLAAVRQDPNVAYVEPDYRGGIASQYLPTGIKRIFATDNQTLDIDEVDERIDVDVAVLDTGVYDHSDLNLAGTIDCSGNPCEKSGAADGNGHGTHVAGTIGALDDDSGVVGVAPGARIWAIKVLDNSGGGLLSEFIAGIDWVTATRLDKDPGNDIEVANASLRYWNVEFSAAFDEALEKSIAHGIVHVAAAGNEGEAVRYVPGNNFYEITVSALEDGNGEAGGGNDPLAEFSNFGGHVDVAAPGVGIWSTLPFEEYGEASGTSMAAPHVAGAAAILAAAEQPQSYSDVKAIRDTIVEEGNLNWNDTSGDGFQEPLLDVSDEAVFAASLEAQPPGVTKPATNLTASAATVAAKISPIESETPETTYQFEYGKTLSYGSVAPLSPIAVEFVEGESGPIPTEVSERITGLTPETTYHFRVKATNEEGTFYGADREFTTLIPKPTISFTHVLSDDLGKTSATLKATINPNGYETKYYFQYATQQEYGAYPGGYQGKTIPISAQAIGSGTADVVVSQTLTGLEPYTDYLYRVVAENSKGTSTGEVEFGYEGVSKIFKTKSGGVFATASSWATWPTAYSVDFADVNNDDLVDIVGRNSSGDVKVGLSSGSKFGTSSSWTTWPTSYSMDFADVNDDGRADIVGRNSSGDVQVGLSTGSKFGTSSSWGTWSTAYSMDFANVSDDRRADIVGRNSSGDVQVGLSTGSKFNTSKSWGNWSTAYSMDFANVNSSGSSFADIVGRNSSGDVQVGLSNGITFKSSSSWGYWPTSLSLSLGDVDDDGRADLAGKESANEVAVGLSTGTRFATGTKSAGLFNWWTTWPTSYSLSLGDVDSDGRADAIGRAGTDVKVGLSIEKLAPDADSQAAANVTKSSATLKGTINPNGVATSYQFEYGKTSGYGLKAPVSAKSVGSGTTEVEVSEGISGLEKGTTYHYRLVATSAHGVGASNDSTFTTPSAPEALVIPATARIDRATVRGVINPSRAATTYQFEYGKTMSFGSKVPVSAASIGSGAQNVEVSQKITGLEETTYYYRISATNEVGTTYSGVESFKPAPTTFTLADSISGEWGFEEGQLLANTVASDSVGNLYVGNEGGRLYKYNSQGEFIKQLAEPGVGEAALSSISNLALDADGNLWVSDNSGFVKLDPTGAYMTTQVGTYYDAVAVDANGYVYFLDGTTIQKCEIATENGYFYSKLVDEWSVGVGVEARDIAVFDDEYMIVVGSFGEGGVVKYDLEGTLLDYWEGPGYATGVTLDDEGNVFVSDSANGIQMFDPSGDLLGQFSPSFGAYARDVAWASGGYLWVTNGEANLEKWKID